MVMCQYSQTLFSSRFLHSILLVLVEVLLAWVKFTMKRQLNFSARLGAEVIYRSRFIVKGVNVLLTDAQSNESVIHMFTLLNLRSQHNEFVKHTIKAT